MMPNKAISKKSDKDLEKSFHAFTQLATDLTVAYQELEDKVSLLTSRLEHVSQERLQELTAKERLANRLEMLLSMLPTAVIVIDGNGIIQECNPTARELLNCTLLNRSWREVIKKVISPKEDDGCEVSLRDGKRISITTRALEEEPGQIVVLHDVTQTRQLQQQLADEHHLAAMGKMVASLAHQIRTPLMTALLYNAQLIDQKFSHSQTKQTALKIEERLTNIEQQVQDMLLCARGGRLSLQEVELKTLLLALQTTINERVLSCGAQLIVQDESEAATIQCHQETLIGALYNLINNALETGQANLHITVTATVSDNQEVLLTIQDDGPGIDTETLEKITTPFFTTRSNGTGLGLDIVQEVITEHNGTMSISSQLGIGTAITITIPAKVKK